MKEISKKLIAIMVVMLMIVNSSMLTLISAAAESIDKSNVSLTAYFIGEDGNKTEKLETSMSNEDLKLVLEIGVSKQGYFNGEVTLNNSNFKIKNYETNTYVSEINENTIKLNQINAGESTSIVLNVTPIKDDTYEIDMLNKTTDIQISGTYVAGENKNIAIKDTKSVTLVLTNPYINNEDNGLNLNANIVTNKVYSINGENKRLIQVEIGSGLQNNLYPVKSTKISLDVLDGVENVQVSKRGTFATNNNKTDVKYDWDKDANKLEINILNEINDGKVEWNKTNNDTILVTYILDEKASLENKEININDEVTIYNEDNTSFNKEANLNDMTEKDGVINYSISATPEIYKGNLYYGEDTNIAETTKVDIRYQKISNKIIIDEGNTVYPVDDTENSANLLYSSTTVNKSELLNILGEEGTLTIKSANGNILSTVTKSILDSSEDENIELAYDAQNNIVIEIENAEKEGVLNLSHKKVLKENQYDKNQMKKFTTLKTEGTLKTEENFEEKKGETTTNLLEPISYAKITSNVNALSTLQQNNNVEFNVILKTDDIKYDLYKNPCVEIILPKEISTVQAQINPVFIDGFTIKENTIYTNQNGNNVLKIALEGEQKVHSNNVSEGIIINVNASLGIDKTVSSRDVEVVLNYTNENSETKNFEEKIGMKIQSKDGLLFYDKVENFNSNGDVLETIANDKVEGKLDVEADAKVLSDKILLVNNYGTEISNITLVEKNNDGIDTELLVNNPVTVSVEGAKVYYSEDSTNWVEDMSQVNKVTAYKVVIEKMNANDFIDITSAFNIPEKLEYDKDSGLIKNLTYSVNGQEISQTKETKLSTSKEGALKLEQREQQLFAVNAASVGQPEENATNEEVNAKVETTLGTKKLNSMDSVHSGEIIKNTITITNNTKLDLTNVKVDVDQQNAVIYDLVEVEVTNAAVTGSDDEKLIEHRYGNWETSKKTFDTIEKLAAGETKVLTYQARIKDVNGDNQQTFGNINVKADNMDIPIKMETVRNTIISGKLELTVENALDEEIENYNGEKVKKLVYLKNISNTDLKNIAVEIQLSKNLYIEDKDLDIDFYDEEANELKDFDKNNVLNIQYDKNENTIRFTITKAKANENILIVVNTQASIIDEKNDKEVSKVIEKATIDKDEYYSNINEKYILNSQDDILLKYYINDENNQKKYKNGDEVTFVIEVKNNSKSDIKALDITNNISDEFELQKAYVKRGEDIKDVSAIEEGLIIASIEKVKSQETIEVIVNTKINYDYDDSNIANNIATVIADGGYTIEKELNIEIEGLNPLDYDDETNEENDNKENDNKEQSNRFKISGLVWNDENRNGKRDRIEKGIKDIDIKLISEEGRYIKDSDGNVMTCKTNDSGEYYFDVPNGKYIVVAMYDNKNYALTEYHKEGVEETENSDMISKEINIDNENKIVAITDAINIENNSVYNIDAGLYKRDKFDLKLDKYITKVSVKNAQGVNQNEYDREKLAKVEIKAKNMKGSTIVVEYGIDISNEGDIEGFASDIVDYIPEGYKFSSELNKDWYLDNGKNLHNSSLENEKIKPGETKTLTLILTKTLDSDSGETSINSAEINKASNVKNVNDSDSTPGNRKNGEDDIGSASLIISINTGAVKIFLGITTVILIISAIVLVIIKKKGGE